MTAVPSFLLEANQTAICHDHAPKTMREGNFQRAFPWALDEMV